MKSVNNPKTQQGGFTVKDPFPDQQTSTSIKKVSHTQEIQKK